MSHHSRHRNPPALRWLAAFCALSVWLLGLFASSAHLHGALHAEAGQADHSCAITLFSEGLENAAVGAEITVNPVFFPAGETVAVQAAPLAVANDRLPPGRGPPSC